MAKKRTKKSVLKINPKRPLEELVGRNLIQMRWKVDRYHVDTPIWQIYREIIRPIIRKTKKRGPRSKRHWSKYPPAIRRGLILVIFNQHHQNRQLYASVMKGTFFWDQLTYRG